MQCFCNYAARYSLNRPTASTLYRCNNAAAYSKHGHMLVRHTGYWCTVRQHQKQHKPPSSSDSQFTTTKPELVNTEVGVCCLNKDRDQCNQPGPLQEQTSSPGCQTPDPNSPAHVNLIIWQPHTLPLFAAAYHTAPAIGCRSNSRLADSCQSERWSSPSCLSRPLTGSPRGPRARRGDDDRKSPEETDGRCPKERIQKWKKMEHESTLQTTTSQGVRAQTTGHCH